MDSSLQGTPGLDRGDVGWWSGEVGEGLPDSQKELTVGVGAVVHHGGWMRG